MIGTYNLLLLYLFILAIRRLLCRYCTIQVFLFVFFFKFIFGYISSHFESLNLYQTYYLYHLTYIHSLCYQNTITLQIIIYKLNNNK